jgi:hypothetical protein
MRSCVICIKWGDHARNSVNSHSSRHRAWDSFCEATKGSPMDGSHHSSVELLRLLPATASRYLPSVIQPFYTRECWQWQSRDKLEGITAACRKGQAARAWKMLPSARPWRVKILSRRADFSIEKIQFKLFNWIWLFLQLILKLFFYYKLIKNLYPCDRPWRPIGLCDIKALTFSRQSVHRWRWGQP